MYTTTLRANYSSVLKRCIKTYMCFSYFGANLGVFNIWHVLFSLTKFRTVYSKATLAKNLCFAKQIQWQRIASNIQIFYAGSLMCDMYCILYLLSFAFPFLLKASLAISGNFLQLATYAVSAWLYDTLTYCNQQLLPSFYYFDQE